MTIFHTIARRLLNFKLYIRTLMLLYLALSLMFCILFFGVCSHGLRDCDDSMSFKIGECNI